MIFRACKFLPFTKFLAFNKHQRIFELPSCVKPLNYKSFSSTSTLNSIRRDNKQDYLIHLKECLEDNNGDAAFGAFNKLVNDTNARNYIENIIQILNQKNLYSTEKSEKNLKIKDMIRIIFKKMKEISLYGNESAQNLHFFSSFSTLEAFLGLVKADRTASAITLSKKICLPNLAHLIQNEQLQMKDFLKILKEINSSKDKFIKDKTNIDPQIAKVLNNFIEVFINSEEYHNNDNLREVCEFVVHLSESFTSINQNLFLLLHKKISDSLSVSEPNNMQIETFARLFPILLSFQKLRKESILELGDIFQKKVPRAAFEPFLLNFMISCYKKIKEDKYHALSSQVFSIFNYLLTEPIQHKDFCLTNLTTQDVCVLGDLIFEKKINLQPLLNLLKSQLESEYRSKIDITVSRVSYIYHMHFNVTDDSLDPEKTLNLWPNNQRPQQIKELVSSFFVKLHPYFNVQGLFLMYYIHSKKYVTLGKNETLLRSFLKRKCALMTEEQIFETLNFFKVLAVNGTYLSWISTFDQAWIKLLKENKNQERFYEIISFLGRNDFVYQDFRTIDVLIDQILTEKVGNMNIRELEFTLNLVLSSRLACYNFFQKALHHFKDKYMTLDFSISINIFSKFAFLGISLDDHILDYLVNQFEQATEKQLTLRHIATPLKLFSSIILLGKFQKYKLPLYKKIFRQISKNLVAEQNHSQIEKEEILGNTQFANNLIFFTEYVNITHPKYFKELEEDPIIGETLEKIRKNFKRIPIYVTKGQTQIISILKSEYPFLELKENVIMDNGVIEFDILVKNQLNGKEFALEIFGPSHFKSWEPSEIMPTGLMGLEIKRKYYPVVVIPYFEWYNLKTRAEKAEYLKLMLRRFMSENVQSQ